MDTQRRGERSDGTLIGLCGHLRNLRFKSAARIIYWAMSFNSIAAPPNGRGQIADDADCRRSNIQMCETPPRLCASARDFLRRRTNQEVLATEITKAAEEKATLGVLGGDHARLSPRGDAMRWPKSVSRRDAEAAEGRRAFRQPATGNGFSPLLLDSPIRRQADCRPRPNRVAEQ